MAPESSLFAAFTAAASEPLVATLTPARSEVLRRALAQAVAAAHAAWPDVALPDHTFVAHLARSLTELEPDGGLPALHLDDLYLACALAAGVPEALSRWERDFTGDLTAVLTRLHLVSAERDELMQHLRERLFVGQHDRPPRILDYAGRGRLRGWLRATALRQGLNVLEARKPSVPLDEQLLRELPLGGDPEIAHLRRTYQADFKAAFAAAVSSLTERDRALLAQHLIDGLGIDALAPIHGVHRATAARWLAAARSALTDGTRAALRGRLKLSDTELDSVVRLLGSDLELSLHRILGRQTDEPAAGRTSA